MKTHTVTVEYLMKLAEIKGRYHHLNLNWAPKLEREAVKRDGGGITVFLEREAIRQEQARKLRQLKRKPQEWGEWS